MRGTDKAGINYTEFADKIRSAAKPRQRNPASAANGNDNLRHDFIGAAHASPRCNKPGNLKRTGKPCGAPAVRGATRCYKHGGMRQVPEHPHNIALLEAGTIDARLQHNRDRRTYWDIPAPVKDIIDSVCVSFPKDYSRKLLGAQSYMLDDGGRAYRRWIKDLKLQ